MKILIGFEQSALVSSTPWQLAMRLQAAGHEICWILQGKHNAEDQYRIANNQLCYPSGEAAFGTAGTVLCQCGKSFAGRCKLLWTLLQLAPSDFDLVLLQCDAVTTKRFRQRGFKTLELEAWCRNEPSGQPTMPPIVDPKMKPLSSGFSYTLVHLPDQSADDLVKMLNRVADHQFVIHSNQVLPHRIGNVDIKRFSHKAFRRDLCGAAAVITRPEAGLASECLYLGIPTMLELGILKRGKRSAAIALHDSSLAYCTRELTPMLISFWLDGPPRRQAIRWPDVVRELIDCCVGAAELPGQGVYQSVSGLSAKLWKKIVHDKEGTWRSLPY